MTWGPFSEDELVCFSKLSSRIFFQLLLLIQIDLIFLGLKKIQSKFIFE